MKLLVLITLLCFQFYKFSEASANQVIGTISKLRGQVSILELGAKEAKSIEMGQTVSREASILTADKSFVQILMLDKSQINLGPNSKIVLDQVNGGKVGVISLLKGMIRAEVIKDESKNAKSETNKDKLYIKSRTAAMGIRGTDFQTSYNPESKITNLITFHGKVAMVKTENQNVPELEAVLGSKTAVMVEGGKFATVTEALKNVTEPIKISPTQYTSLKLNPDMMEKTTVTNEVFQEELKKTFVVYNELSKKEVENKNLGAKLFNTDNQVFRPTAGGVVDLTSGIYVPPSSTESNYVKDLNIYEFKSDKGSVTDIGNYLPPQGIKLDSKLGFIAESTNDSKVSELRVLNNDITGQIKKAPKPRREDLGNDKDDTYEKYFIKE